MLVSGTNGIVVSAGVSDVVILRNLRLSGIGSGLSGILYNSGGQIRVEKCHIFGFTQSGISVNATNTTELYVTNSYITNTPNGITPTTGQIFGATDHTSSLTSATTAWPQLAETSTSRSAIP